MNSRCEGVSQKQSGKQRKNNRQGKITVAKRVLCFCNRNTAGKISKRKQVVTIRAKIIIFQWRNIRNGNTTFQITDIFIDSVIFGRMVWGVLSIWTFLFPWESVCQTVSKIIEREWSITLIWFWTVRRQAGVYPEFHSRPAFQVLYGA